MVDRKISEAYSLNPTTPLGTDMLPLERVGDTTIRACQVAGILGLFSGAGVPGGTHIGSALTGNGSTDVTAVLQASINGVQPNGTWVLDPGTAGWSHRITDTLVVPRNINVDMSMAEVVATFTDRPMMVIGDEANENSYQRLVLRVRGTMSSGTFQAAVNQENVGVRFHNIRDSEIQLWTERTVIGHEMVSQQSFGVTGLRTVVHRSVDHKIHCRCVCRGLSADPNATPGSDMSGDYLNGNTWYFGRMDNTGSIIGSTVDAIGIRFDGTHGGYNGCHGNTFFISQCQPQNSSVGKRKPVSFGPGQNVASSNKFIFAYWESGNGEIGEFDPSNSGNVGNIIEVLDWVPGSGSMVLGWAGGASGFGGLNYIRPPVMCGSGESFFARERKPGWSSGRLVDKVSYYNDGQITLDGLVFHKITSDNMQTYQSKPLSANINPRYDTLGIVTGGLFFWINTENCKKFAIFRDCIPGFGGRFFLAPADVNKNLIPGGGEIRAAPNMALNAGSSYVGAANSYMNSTQDNDLPIVCAVSAATKWLLCGILQGSNVPQIREFHVVSMDDTGRAPLHVAGADDFGERKSLVAAKAPAISTGGTLFGYGRYRRGDRIKNDGSVTAIATTDEWAATQDQILAPTWQASATVAVGMLRTGTAAGGASGNVYRCVVAGTSTTGNGPTGTSKTTPVVDGTAQWLYAGPAWAAWTAIAP